MAMEPSRIAGSRAHDPAGFIILAQNHFTFAVFPRRRPCLAGPRYRVAFPAQTQKHRTGLMSVAARIAAGRILRDKTLETVSRQIPEERAMAHPALRSEERRVGKECRST